MESTIAFSDSNDLSGSSVTNSEGGSPPLEVPDPDVAALKRLSENLESVFELPESESFADAKIVVDAPAASSGHLEVPVHRCLLSARSPFFKKVFSVSARNDGAPVVLQMKELAKDFNVGFDSLVAVLSYLYSGKVRPLPKNVCVCVDEDCDHVACRPALDFLVEVLYAAFVFQICELFALYQRRLLDILNKAAIDDILVVLPIADICGKCCQRLIGSCIEMLIKSDIDFVNLEKALPPHTVKQITDRRLELFMDDPETIFPDKHVKRIHRALDSDDVELVRMLLTEAHTTLDNADALHYAVAYCDPKTTTELLDLNLADVNHRNFRGDTVLHVAARRKEPQIVASLLTKGAKPSDLTSDGRKAVQIAKRVTRAVDYYISTEQGKPTPRDRLCIEILEQAESDPLPGEASESLTMVGDDLREKLLYHENRVGLAKLLFPMEAKVAMDIAQVDGTSEFSLAGTPMDLNDAPFKLKEEHLSRLRALSKTVELGKRFFPQCSKVLNDIMDAEDLSQLASVANGTPEERLLKRRRYMELQDIVSKAFTEDKEAAFTRSGLSSSSSTSKQNARLPLRNY